MADAPDALATVAELETWIGETLDDEEQARAAFILQIGSGWAREIAGRLWLHRDAVDFPVTVRGIILQAARREFENPRRVVYEVRGPESSSYNAQHYVPGFFQPAETKALQRYRRGGGLYTVQTYRDDPCGQLGYIYMGPYSKPLPYFNPGDPGYETADHL